jgi:hypothetical protein
VDAWKTFQGTQIAYFTTFGKPEWQALIDKIIQNMSELGRLRSILLNKQERFECKLRNASILEWVLSDIYTDTILAFHGVELD